MIAGITSITPPPESVTGPEAVIREESLTDWTDGIFGSFQAIDFAGFYDLGMGFSVN